VTFEEVAPSTEGSHYALSLIRKAKVQSGPDVLVNGATGAIGSAAVQLLKSLGAEVTAVCDTENVELVRGLGADRVIDDTAADFTKDEQTYDVVLDSVGKSSFRPMQATVETARNLSLFGVGSSVPESDLGAHHSGARRVRIRHRSPLKDQYSRSVARYRECSPAHSAGARGRCRPHTASAESARTPSPCAPVHLAPRVADRPEPRSSGPEASQFERLPWFTTFYDKLWPWV